MLNESVCEFRPVQSIRVDPKPFQPELVDDLPDVPALPETLLLMELRIHEFSVDLQEVSQLVLGDVGATLQILRLAGREYGASHDHPMRIEDCICDLGLQSCLMETARQTFFGDSRHRAAFEFWAHAREIAQACKVVAEESSEAVNPEEAYLVGLCHMLGILPSVLGWGLCDRGIKGWAHVGAWLAKRWALPLCLQQFSREMLSPASDPRWARILRKAHLIARRSPTPCPFHEVPALQLHHRP